MTRSGKTPSSLSMLPGLSFHQTTDILYYDITEKGGCNPSDDDGEGFNDLESHNERGGESKDECYGGGSRGNKQVFLFHVLITLGCCVYFSVVEQYQIDQQ